MKKLSFPVLLTIVVWVLIAFLAIQDVTGTGLFRDDPTEIPEATEQPSFEHTATPSSHQTH